MGQLHILILGCTRSGAQGRTYTLREPTIIDTVFSSFVLGHSWWVCGEFVEQKMRRALSFLPFDRAREYRRFGKIVGTRGQFYFADSTISGSLKTRVKVIVRLRPYKLFAVRQWQARVLLTASAL